MSSPSGYLSRRGLYASGSNEIKAVGCVGVESELQSVTEKILQYSSADNGSCCLSLPYLFR